MIDLILFKQNVNCIAAKSVVMFKNGVNLIVGDQGCGKSTLLSQINYFSKARSAKKKSWNPDADKCKIDLLWIGDPKKYGYFDFEKHNPRTQAAFDMGHGYDTRFQINAMFSSHGETVKPLLFGLTETMKDAVAVLDEPDMALSPRSIYRLIKDLKRIEEEGSAQVVLSAHNPLLIASFPEVCSLEHGRWMPSHEFLELQATTESPKYKKDETRMFTIARAQPKDKASKIADELIGE